jgi:hypothetical protein
LLNRITSRIPIKSTPQTRADQAKHGGMWLGNYSRNSTL